MPRQPVTLCIHRWRLGQPEFEGTPGQCRVCGETRFFPSGLELEADAERPEAPRDRASKEARAAAADWYSLN
jgi:hypothetical protein